MSKHTMLYHGSRHEIKKTLKPRPSKVINGEKAVFATDSKDMAVVFIPRWTDCDIDLGYHNGILYCIEQYPDAFDLFRCGGYLYYVRSKEFKSDPRLGMPRHEFVSGKPVDIVHTDIIDDVMEYLSDSTVCMVTYDEKITALYNQGLIHK